MTENYDLDQTVLDEIFAQDILPSLFANARPADQPIWILLGGQPGAGKTRAGNMAMESREMVKIIGDDLRQFHPGFEELLRLDPDAMPRHTQQAMVAWLKMAESHAAENRFSALVEGTWRTPSVPAGAARRFAGLGYQVEARVVAVSPQESRLSTLERFIRDKKKSDELQTTGHKPSGARFVALWVQLQAEIGLPESVKLLCAPNSKVGRMTVQTRDTILTDQTRRSLADHLSPMPGHLDALRREHNRPMADDEFADWVERATLVDEYLQKFFPDDIECMKMSQQLDDDLIVLRQRRDDRSAGKARTERFMAKADEIITNAQSRDDRQAGD